jgi:Rps23 Pro-64 3,4-dihydroxylase Tpa1-like proline 4-hydroxylase
MESVFNPEVVSDATVERLKKYFNEIPPYRHFYIDGFLKEEFANKLYENFPAPDDMTRKYNGLNEKKAEGTDFSKFNPAFQELKDQLAKPEINEWLTKITGIKDVFSIDDPLGAGVHQGENGSYLDIHIDFNIHPNLNIYRRLNLLIFLNKNWKEEYGGHSEMWNADVSELGAAYLPSWNRCVVFESSQISYHGYAKINIPPGESRKSFFNYYYTKEHEGGENKYHDTVFKARPEEGLAKKIKTDVKEGLKNNIKRVLKKVGVKL